MLKSMSQMTQAKLRLLLEISEVLKLLGKASILIQLLMVHDCISSTTVTLKEDEIKLVVEECDISREAAEALLKANHGDINAALVAFARGEFQWHKVNFNK